MGYLFTLLLVWFIVWANLTNDIKEELEKIRKLLEHADIPKP